MPSDETRVRILDSATRHFAADGFAGASMRRIVEEAEVNLSAVNYHFGSKSGLYRAVMERLVAPLVDERLAKLRELQVSGGFTTTDLIAALLDPALALARAPGHGPAWVLLNWRSRLEHPDRWDSTELHEPMIRAFMAAFRGLLPELSEREVEYRFFFMMGAIANALIDPRSFTFLEGGLPSLRDDDSVRGRLLRFLDAGVAAPVVSAPTAG